MDLIKTIDDDAEIQYESDDVSGGEEEDETASKKVTKVKKNTQGQKVKGLNSGGEFFDEFNFVYDAKEYMKDTWYVCVILCENR